MLDDLFGGIRDGLKTVRDEVDVAAIGDRLRNLDELVEGTPTFLERRVVAQAAVESMWAAYQETYRAMLKTQPVGLSWPAYLTAEFRPMLTRAIFDLRAAQVREQIDLVIPELRRIKADLEGWLALAGGAA